MIYIKRERMQRMLSPLRATIGAPSRRPIVAGAVLALLIAAVFVAFDATRAQIPAPASPPSYDPATIAKGGVLALIGNCNVCHTASQGRSYAGGRPMQTPFGVMYSPNITPDPETGIGRWSEAAFARAMREGIGADGRELYPAFPYDHYARVADDDVRALYAFLMSRDPVRAARIADRLHFPFNIRPLVRVWKLLYFRPEPFSTDAARSAQWNRGAYLVEGLGHCGACHTPRNALGAERKTQALEGGEAEGWQAPALTAASPSPAPWSADALVAYLQTGLADDHEMAAGPMAPVVHNLARVSEQDVRAIAVYITSLEGAPAPAARTLREPAAAVAQAADPGAPIYESMCAQCHDDARGDGSHAALALDRSTSVALNSPDNVIRIVRDGIVPDGEQPHRLMPGFAGALTDAQTVALVDHLRVRFAHAPPWPDAARSVARIRGERAH